MAALCRDARQTDIFSLLATVEKPSEAKPAGVKRQAAPVVEAEEYPDLDADELETITSEKGYQFLTAEEEIRLVRAYKENGDQKAGRQLYEAFMPMLWAVARKKCARIDHVQDAFQAAGLGFFEALKGFEPDRGFRLYSFVHRNVSSHVLQMMRREHVTTLTIGTKGRGLYYRLIREESRSKRETGSSLGYDDIERIAEETAIDVQKVLRMHETITAQSYRMETSSASENDGHQFSPKELSPYGESQEEDTPESNLSERQIEDQRKVVIEECLAELDPREREIIMSRFFSETKETFKSLGERFGVSNEYIRRLQEKSLDLMRQHAVKLAREGKLDMQNLL